MTEIYSNDSLKIIQDRNNKTMYKIEFNYPCPALIRSLTKTHIIQSGTVTDDYSTLRFKSLSVKSFYQFIEDQNKSRGSKTLSINLAANMITNLSAQLSHLIKSESKTIIGYAPENIIVINDKTFAFLDSELVADIDPVGKEMATISCPFNVTDFFVSPEVLDHLCLMSGGHLRLLMKMIRKAIDWTDDLPITKQAVNIAIEEAKNDYRNTIFDAQWALLQDVAATKQILNNENDHQYQRLLASRCILQYRYYDENDKLQLWYDVHPLVKDLEKFSL